MLLKNHSSCNDGTLAEAMKMEPSVIFQVYLVEILLCISSTNFAKKTASSARELVSKTFHKVLITAFWTLTDLEL